ncbi:sigma-70 family RNA polymerase sigma factor [uncultured Gimesia sp.]|uniref:RNA polymerase sigma factor n=1 Tax=uncultured Gimesia sp. TaxID=1678688 RepID=UPI0030DACCF4
MTERDGSMKPDNHSNLASQSQSQWHTRSSMIFDLKEFSQERWNNFVLVYSPLLKYWIRKKNVPPSAEDDVLQEALSKIHKSIGNFERDAAKGKFRGWLRTIVERRAADYFRSLTEDQRAPQEVLDAVVSRDQKDAEEIDGEQQALEEVKARALELVRESTAEKTWQMFYMNTVDGVPPAEIAKQFGTTKANVRVAKSRVLGRLRKYLIDDLTDKP